VIHWLYADRQELALFAASRRNDPPAVATLFWPYFVPGDGAPRGRVKSRYHALNKAALASLIRRDKLAFLAVHTERIKGLLLPALGLEPDRVVVVPDPAIPMSLPPRAEARAALDVAEGEKLMLFFGGMRLDKGPDLLVDALQRMTDVPGWKAYLAGASGVLTAEGIATRLRESGLEDRIQAQIGYVSDAQMAQCFAAADVVVLPYRSTFLGTSGVLQTSAVAGRPVLATDVGEVGTAVREFGLGHVVLPDSVDELERGLRSILANMEAFRLQCATGSLRYSAEHSPDRLVEGLIPAYVSALARA
jgi:glycosyltransferase involved in cell wall biosynthesis